MGNIKSIFLHILLCSFIRHCISLQIHIQGTSTTWRAGEYENMPVWELRVMSNVDLDVGDGVVDLVLGANPSKWSICGEAKINLSTSDNPFKPLCLSFVENMIPIINIPIWTTSSQSSTKQNVIVSVWLHCSECSEVIEGVALSDMQVGKTSITIEGAERRPDDKTIVFSEMWGGLGMNLYTYTLPLPM